LPHEASTTWTIGIGKLQTRPVITTEYLANLPVFQPDRDKAPWPESVLRWRADFERAEAVIISTPAYLHNIPGVLKNALDWLASSGEFDAKPTLVFTFTPGAPRGDKARQSLLWSLAALNARVLAEAPFYQKAISFNGDGSIIPGDERDILIEALNLL